MARQASVEDAEAASRIAAGARRLAAARVRNAGRIGVIAARRAAAAGWGVELAADYLGRMLRYDIGPRQMQAIEQFFAMAYDLQLIDAVRPVRTAGVDGHASAGIRGRGQPTHDAAPPAT
jgi:hypothetical protein